MSKIIPFEALIPNPKLAAKIICPPYDVIESDQARKMAEGNPYSFLHVAKPEIDLPPSVDQYDDRVYAKAVENLRDFREKNYLVRDCASIYLYRQVLNGRPQTGVVCCVSAEEYEKGLIKKHELTRKPKEDDRTRHMMTMHAHGEPVMIAHRKNASVKKLIEQDVKAKPLYDLTDHAGVQHVFWRVAGPRLRTCADFAKIDALYIADGHHRSAGRHARDAGDAREELRAHGRRGVQLLPGRGLRRGRALRLPVRLGRPAGEAADLEVHHRLDHGARGPRTGSCRPSPPGSRPSSRAASSCTRSERTRP